MNGNFQSIKELLDILDLNEVNYLILRNYENILNPDLYVSGHGDIDILCEDSQMIVNLLDAKTSQKDIKPFKGDGTHYYIWVDKKKVFLDLRFIGDDYYCEKWERDMLVRRVKRDCYYILSPIDYFYSLIYHAILQKKYFSKEYQIRLLEMANALNICVGEGKEIDFLDVLEQYMTLHGYRYRYTKDVWIPLRFNLVNKGLVDINFRLKWKHLFFEFKLKYSIPLTYIKNFVLKIFRYRRFTKIKTISRIIKRS